MYSKLAPNKEYILLANNKLLEKYIEEIGENDKNALENLYEATKNVVYGYALSLLKNKSDAEDIFQEVYIKIYENAYSYQKKGKALAWILTITKNLCYMKFRKDKDNLDIDDMKDIIGKNINADDKIVLTNVFKNISKEEREIILLHILGGLKHREIAKILDLSLSTVLSKYNRAIKKLKILLEGDIS